MQNVVKSKTKSKPPSLHDVWIPVSSKNKKKAAKAHLPATIAKKENTLVENRFYIPPGSGVSDLPKKKNTEVAKASFATIAAKEENTTRVKTFKRNQRRSRKRAKNRAKKETEVTAPKNRELDVKPAIDITTKVDDSGSTKENPGVMALQPQTAENSECYLLNLPYDILTGGILSFLSPRDMETFGCCNKYAKDIAEDGFLWRSVFQTRFPLSQLSPNSMKEWKLAYKLMRANIVERLRCIHTKKNFFEDVLGSGIDFTINPKTNRVDYISMSQDLLSATAFTQGKIRTDAFGNKFKLFLPLFFSAEHFQRSLPQVRKTIVRLCPERNSTRFDPSMVLDVMPKIINTFIVLVADEGISASRKSFLGFTRVHRLFLALAHQYPTIKVEALRRLKLFVASEENRVKSACPSLGNLLPLLSVVDQSDFDWSNIRPAYLGESFDRSVLWVCKAHPKLEKTHSSTGEVECKQTAEERVTLTLEAMKVNLRLLMFHVYFMKACCRNSTTDRAILYDRFFGQPDPEDISPNGTDDSGSKDHDGVDTSPPLSYTHFQRHVTYILSVNTWQRFFKFIGVRCPSTKGDLARILRNAVKNSRCKGYHKAGMDFSRVHANGTSKILAKGQQYSTSSDLRQVMFNDRWGFHGNTVYLDASCLLYRGRKLIDTVEYINTRGPADSDAVQHSGDVMHASGGTHTIHLDLQSLDAGITSCVFVISAWADAKLSDIVSPSISFTDEEADGEPLCTYNLDAHDKISHLTSVIMCKLYRKKAGGGWHVLAIGDAYRGAADNYGPIYSAVQKYL
mmetsp:Transcript_31352/g.47617  ORF Transcript_31352/g.47617 Transcript_31352/m.47617 type:complete len:794 (-) Transcript_31352:112-2493(-)